MERWQGKVAVVTGASSGIGLATAKALVSHGLTVVGLARRRGKMENDMKNVTGPGKFYARECDITRMDSIVENFNWVKETLGTINVLVNNAGILKYKTMEDASVAELDEIINVNLLGTLHCSKQALAIMKSNNKEAHIVNVNSTLGHKISPSNKYNVYPATKYAITALTETLSYELKDSKIRVSSVSPGLVLTELVERIRPLNPNLENSPALQSEDIANAIVYIIGVPPHVEISDVIVRPKAVSN